MATVTIEEAQAKLRELIRLGAGAVEGPWDGEEGITLLPDLDAGATGSMTGGAYPDGLKAIVDAHEQGRRVAAVRVARVQPGPGPGPGSGSPPGTRLSHASFQ